TLAARMGFALRHNVIEAHGLCAGCVEVEACSTPGHCHHDHTIQIKKKPAEAIAAAGIQVAGTSMYHRAGNNKGLIR
ncbi:hypothetical protein UA70_18570, partial [Raoultella planticola]